MPNLSKLDTYLKVDHIKDGTILRLANGGRILEKEFKQNGITTRRNVLEIDVELPDGSKKIFTVNNMTRKALEPAYGSNSDNWAGKHVVAKLVLKEVFGDMKNNIVLFPDERNQSSEYGE